MSSPACILSFLATAFTRGEFRDAWTWSDDPEQQKPAEKVPAEPLASPEVRNENNESPASNGNASGHADGEATEAGEEEAVEQSDEAGETKSKKKKSKGKKKA